MILFLETRINIPFSGNQIICLGACGFGSTEGNFWAEVLAYGEVRSWGWPFEGVGAIVLAGDAIGW